MFYIHSLLFWHFLGTTKFPVAPLLYRFVSELALKHSWKHFMKWALLNNYGPSYFNSLANEPKFWLLENCQCSTSIHCWLFRHFLGTAKFSAAPLLYRVSSELALKHSRKHLMKWAHGAFKRQSRSRNCFSTKKHIQVAPQNKALRSLKMLG